MTTREQKAITVTASVQAPIATVWRCWTNPADIIRWNNASDDWHTPSATNDVRAGGTFLYRMEAKDGSSGFDFGGVYDRVEPNEYIAYTIDDGRVVEIRFDERGSETTVVETFEAERQHPVELQREGWQAILDNFKNYVEGKH